ncbi:MAG: site-specific DNA-methyltransferase [Labilithrix sp.]|nr:site-specific DNA-methyltransferase [Labilithrix sp.]
MKSVALGPATLYLGDAAEIVPTLESVDLLATDPPWLIAQQSHGRRKGDLFGVIHGDRGEVDVPSILTASVRRLRDHRHLYVFGPAHLLELVPQISTPRELIWDKEMHGGGDLTTPWGPGHEPISFAVRSQRTTAKTEGVFAARMRQSSVLRGARANAAGTTRHPHEKSLEVMRRIVEASSNLGDLVLDPFMGSGTTIVAALLEGRRAIGIEIDERWFDVAVERVQRILPMLRQLESA